MIYLDSSCLVKFVRMEVGSDAVIRAISRESFVVISALAELETLVQLKAGYMAGQYGLAQRRRFELELHALRNEEPFHFKALPAGIWEEALRQHRNSGEVHCRTLDRLHLAAVEKLGVPRLMTHDKGQAEAARELGIEVVEPQ